jgi:hypothetical protein
MSFERKRKTSTGDHLGSKGVYMANKRGSLDGLKNLRSKESFLPFPESLERDAVDSCELAGDKVAPPTKGESINI